MAAVPDRSRPSKEVSEWVEQYRRFWEQSLDRLDEYLKELHKKSQGEEACPATQALTSPRIPMEREMVITRVLDAPRKLVFGAWTDPKHIGSWWGPRGFTTTVHQMDVRPGGEWRIIMHGPNGVDYPNKIVYLEIAKPERLVYDHGDEGQPGYFRVTVTFEDQGKKTKLTMRSLFTTAAERDHVVGNITPLRAGIRLWIASLSTWQTRLPRNLGTRNWSSRACSMRRAHLCSKRGRTRND